MSLDLSTQILKGPHLNQALSDYFYSFLLITKDLGGQFSSCSVLKITKKQPHLWSCF